MFSCDSSLTFATLTLSAGRGWLINLKEFGRSSLDLRHYTGICLEGLRKITTHLSATGLSSEFEPRTFQIHVWSLADSETCSIILLRVFMWGGKALNWTPQTHTCCSTEKETWWPRDRHLCYLHHSSGRKLKIIFKLLNVSVTRKVAAMAVKSLRFSRGPK
jgi:hypothetical protein